MLTQFWLKNVKLRWKTSALKRKSRYYKRYTSHEDFYILFSIGHARPPSLKKMMALIIRNLHFSSIISTTFQYVPGGKRKYSWISRMSFPKCFIVKWLLVMIDLTSETKRATSRLPIWKTRTFGKTLHIIPQCLISTLEYCFFKIHNIIVITHYFFLQWHFLVILLIWNFVRKNEVIKIFSNVCLIQKCLSSKYWILAVKNRLCTYKYYFCPRWWHSRKWNDF